MKEIDEVFKLSKKNLQIANSHVRIYAIEEKSVEGVITIVL